MKVEFIEPAFIELDDAIEYYNVQSSGLGNIFLEKVLTNVRLIAKFPSAWLKYTENTYTTTLRKFPYNLIFSRRKRTIYIIAVAHHLREPTYWIKRLLT